MTTDDKIRDEKLQCDSNREAAKISLLWLGKINKCEYLTSEEILLSNQIQDVEQAKCTYCLLKKALKNFKLLKVLNPAELQQKPKSNGGAFPKQLEKMELRID